MIIEVGQKLMSSVMNVRKVYSARKSAVIKVETRQKLNSENCCVKSTRFFRGEGKEEDFDFLINVPDIVPLYFPA